jgi:DNA-binding beta-propeller fold protein YncE
MLATLLALLALLASCRPSPSPELPPRTLGTAGAYILCEGLWRQDNSTLSRYDRASGSAINDVFASVNAGLRLGDTGNDMVALGDTLYIAVSTSRTIEALRLSTGQSLGRLRLLGQRQEPRKIAIVNDSTAFATLLNDDAVVEFHPRTLRQTRIIAVGPAPEGIAATDRYVFVANSGYGDFRAREPKAGEISVIQLASRREIAAFNNLPNVLGLTLSPDKTRLYATYKHLPSLRDSLGGIVEFDTERLQELRRWRLRNPSAVALTAHGDSLFVLAGGVQIGANVSSNDVWFIPLKTPNAAPRLMVSNPDKRAMWYGLAADALTGELWVCNARNFSIEGAVQVFSPQGVLRKQFDVGVNPNTVVFF